MDRVTGSYFSSRSEVFAQNAMAATSQPLATKLRSTSLNLVEMQSTQRLLQMLSLDLSSLPVPASVVISSSFSGLHANIA